MLNLQSRTGCLTITACKGIEVKTLFFILFLSLNVFSKNSPRANQPPQPERLIKVLTYNVWMVDFPFELVSHDVQARAAAIPAELAKTGADIIALQEVWPDKKKKSLSEDFKKIGYPYSYYEDLPASWLLRGLVGNGLVIISKYPLETLPTLRQRVLGFTNYTRPDEYFARKGVLHVRVNVPDWGVMNLYDTHYGAESYVPELKKFNIKEESARINQAHELFEFIKTTKDDFPVLLMGDLNSYFKILSDDKYTDQFVADYVRLTCAPASDDCLELNDSFHTVNSYDKIIPSVDGSRNPYVGTSIAYKGNSPPPRMIDYIFVTKSEKIKAVESKIVLDEKIMIPGRAEALPLSDHFGVLSTFQLR